MNHECNILKREEKRITSFLSDIQFLGIGNDLIVTGYLRTFGHLKKLKSLGNSIEKHSQYVNLLHVLKFAQFLTNLERLVTFCDHESDDFFQVENQLPIFGNLLDLQLVDTSSGGSYTLTKFLNLCPNVLNLFLIVNSYRMDLMHQINRNFNVQRLDLFIFRWNSEKMIKTIEKFPNCRYLSIRGESSLSSDELIHIISTLPHLSLLLIEHAGRDSADQQVVKNFCHSQNRKIDVYFGSTNAKLFMFHELNRLFFNHFLHK
ncbi:uncharacterized protein LOC128394170 [Panonychus citri]|uniref:uncharacterized protein LOC128394170 n=1 Tax=Panonychus citri TaxID=50023 RepID=UPI0023077D2B|nr:uncharacterized protein LOC128394170 [Panonychus citri]